MSEPLGTTDQCTLEGAVAIPAELPTVGGDRPFLAGSVELRRAAIRDTAGTRLPIDRFECDGVTPICRR